MLVINKPEYKALVQAVMVSMDCNREQAEWELECVMEEIEQGESSYASAAIGLNLRVNLVGQCGFDASDYLSAIC